MEKESFNQASKNVDDPVSFSTNEMERGARELLKAMSKSQGKTMGEIASEAIWKEANQHFNTQTIQRILSRKGIKFEV